MGTHTDIDLNSLLVFAAVVEAGGFTAAAERLGINKARVSQTIARLESQLGASVFSRTTRRVSLTELGEALYARCVPHLREARQALDEVSAGDDEDLAGSLRLTASVDHATQDLARVLALFGARHPRLQIELRTSDRVVDLVEEGLDLGLRVGWLRDSSLRAIKLGDFDQWVVASPDYLAMHSPIDAPELLVAHAWVALTLLPTPLTWTFTRADEVRTIRTHARMRTDSAASLRALLRHGAGVSVIDSVSAERDVAEGKLTRVLAEWSIPSGGIYAVLPPGRHLPRKVRLFLDFYRETLTEVRGK